MREALHRQSCTLKQELLKVDDELGDPSSPQLWLAIMLLELKCFCCFELLVILTFPYPKSRVNRHCLLF